ncbi:MAG: hypothetical protein JSW39_01445 [Desulfobacterales bacterium]|nr:MAG: hypothetical protein JSW39_01445 [Desulfobacterales bacterium]
MRASDITVAVYADLEKQGYQGKIISIKHVEELHRAIEGQYQQGLFDETFCAAELTGFDFKFSDGFAGAKSLIIVAAPQPQVSVIFNWEGQSLRCIIPPIYSYATDKQIKELLEAHLKPEGYHLTKAALPLKLAAVRSGLAQYGRNNITYVAGMGSFHRLAAFISDFPCREDHWTEPEALDHCRECQACLRACPTGAIAPDRFLLHGERCLTFHNERPGAFPAWIHPGWHNCLVGCLFCQKACPVDKDLLKMVEARAAFAEVETASLLSVTAGEKIPPETRAKLAQLDIIEYLDLLGRNLKVLIEKRT